MTVCIAARCIDGSIFCVADRMITVGDIEMESPVPKLFKMTNAIVVMPSDEDAALHTEILNDMHAEIALRVSQRSDEDWLNVSEVVEIYIDARNRTKAKLAERAFLSPLGLTHETFHHKMATMEPGLVNQIAQDLVSYQLPSLSLLVAGMDLLGSHIYEVHDGEPGCFNKIGYAAIGAGARHARAHFMMSGQSGDTSIAESLWNTYLGKKRSEVAPGVGIDTDIAMVGPRIGQMVHLNDASLIKQLETVYRKTKRMEEKARKTASKEMFEYVEELGRQQSQKVTTQEAPALEGGKREAAE